ncbi:hypothetical protein [Flavobacterium aestivum]|uniref:hypothetical protein n=1 Tax=Flavobacterium aestivum TaxID=3003257 RepID=UPI00228697A1|nr:hypothetical protein [Flavobacterium aestivum]
MKLIAQNYVSPIITEGTFQNVFIEETSIQLKRKDSRLRIDFDMYYIKNGCPIVLASSYIAFQGMNDDPNSTNRKATFKFNNSEEVHGLIEYVAQNGGQYPTDYIMVDWGCASYEDALTYLFGGSFQNPELHPVNDFVRAWILNTVVMKSEYIGNQFQFVE